MSELLPNPPRLGPIPAGTETCGCCAGVVCQTPRAVENRSGLSAIAYRIGTYSEFRASLQAGLSSAEFAELSPLRTRDTDDFTIGVLDAVACAADVLTFYQERIANESYLRTAREQVSLQQMGRLIGYRLRPGVAAETMLAFTLETPPTPPASLKPEPGTFVSGVPAEVKLDSGLAIRSVPAPGEQPQVFETVEPVTMRPTWNAMQPWMSQAARPARGDVATFLSGVSTRLRAGDALLFVGDEYVKDHTSNKWDFRILNSVVTDVANDRTFVSWSRPLGSVSPSRDPAAQPNAFALRQRAAVYGHNAPAWGSMPADFRTNYEAAFPNDPPPPSIILESVVSAPGDWPRFVISPFTGSVDLDTLYSEIASGSFSVLAKGSFNYPAEPAPGGTYIELFVVTNVSEVSREEFAFSGKVTRLHLDGDNYAQFANEVRGTTVFAQSEPLSFAEYPVSDPVSGSRIPLAVAPDGLTPGRRLIVKGTRESDGAATVHTATLVAVNPVAGGSSARSMLEIDPPLPAALVRSSVVVHANVALASHGESVTQILGSGNAATPFQCFELKQLPLTFRAAATESGAAPELTVRVDDIAWKDRDTLFGTAPRDQMFTLVADEQGRAFVEFGDGARGARLPSGVNNVRARFRKGLGVSGNVRADSLTQLTTRPLGLKGVSNPRPAEGGTDPESADQARQTMPLTTRTLGRAVSVLDYEDYARAYSGIAKARAEVLHLRSGPTVVITIAGPNGTLISADSPIWTNLRDALAANGDPHVAVRLLSYNPSTFRIGLSVKTDLEFETTAVLAGVETALRTYFDFDARNLGQPIQQSEVIHVVHGVPGVVAMNLELLYGGSQPAAQTVPSRQTRLLASRMCVQAGNPIPDELLTLDPAPFDRLQEMT
jgi:hypothetical protein